MTTRLLYFASHPIQYQAPLLRLIAAAPDIDLTVIFADDFSTASYFDAGFGVDVAWDVPLRDGYHSVLLSEIEAEDYIKNTDVVWFHGWQSRRFRQLMRVANAAHKPVLMRGENWAGAMPDGPGLRGWLKRRYLAHIFAKCDAYLAIGSANRRYYLDHGIAENKIFDMPYAVDNAFFASRASAAAAAKFRGELGLAADQKIILFAGKFSARKNPDVLLDAWSQAKWSAATRPALVFVGDGELKPLLLQAAERAEFKADIHFTGFRNQTELPAIYRAADVFVLASLQEPWGLGINEAMASGTAVIASDQCGAVFDLISDATGKVVEAGNTASLATALVEVIAQSEVFGAAAQQRVGQWDFGADLAGLKSALEFVR